MDLKSQFETNKSECISRYQGVNLYVKNLDDTIDDGRLREEFSAYGTITSAKVMMDDKDNSKSVWASFFNFSYMNSPDRRKYVVECYCMWLHSHFVNSRGNLNQGLESKVVEIREFQPFHWVKRTWFSIITCNCGWLHSHPLNPLN